VEYPYDSREEIIRSADSTVAGVLLPGDGRPGLQVWLQGAADSERSGRIALAMESWAFLARRQIALG
jgi:hypothetical protein